MTSKSVLEAKGVFEDSTSAILIKNNAFKTWHRNWLGKSDQTVCINRLCWRWLMVTFQSSNLQVSKSRNHK